MAVVGEVFPCEREVNNFVLVIFVLMLESENFWWTKISRNMVYTSMCVCRYRDQNRTRNAVLNHSCISTHVVSIVQGT